MKRVRFAPSPTGIFHVGGARSALFNWAIANQTDGKFILRIEDTDASRNEPQWVDGIISALAWLGINEDSPVFEGPYFQSGNVSAHHGAIDRLLNENLAYYCDCTREDLLKRTGDQNKGYDGFCRNRGLAKGPNTAVRFHTPDEGTTTVVDLIRGKPEFPNTTIEDFVIARSDGSPTFVLANVVDDISQSITEVIRGEEHLSNTPKQQMLWEALGETPPLWAHLPLIVNEKRQKLSKRRDKVALESYQQEGYLSAAMINYLMLLGWSAPGESEIVSWDEMVKAFQIEDINVSPAFFDEAKLRSFNGEYLRAMPLNDFIASCQPWLKENVPWQESEYQAEIFNAVAELAQTRLSVLSEIVGLVDWLFCSSITIDEAAWNKAMGEQAPVILGQTIESYSQINWEPEALKEELQRIGESAGLKLGKAQAPIRVAVTGKAVGLPLFESLVVFGREPTLNRLRSALDRLSGSA